MSEPVNRGLTWSKKWHIVNPDHPNSHRYAVSLCGAYLYRDDDPQYPQHLLKVKEGKAKSAGDCKSCARSAGMVTDAQRLDEVRALADKWYTATDLGTDNVNYVARAFAEDLYKALDGRP